MGLYLRNKTWWIYFSVANNQYRESAHTEDKEEAYAVFLKRKKEVIEAGMSPGAKEKAHRLEQRKAINDKSDIRLEHAVDLALSEHFARVSTPANLKITRYALYKIVRILGPSLGVSQITEAHYLQLRDALREEGSADSTVNHYFAGLNRVLKFVRKEHGANCEPGFKGVYLGVYTRRKRTISPEEEAFIRNYFLTVKYLKGDWSNRDLCEIIDLLFNTGMRRGELFKFTVGMVHDNRIEFQSTEHKSGRSKGAKSVALNERARRIITSRTIRYNLGSEDKVFPYTPVAFTRLWNTMRKVMGLEDDTDFVPHTIRHTFATRLLEKDVSIYVVKELMGHSSVTTTEGYAHVQVSKLVDTTEMLYDEQDQDDLFAGLFDV